MFFMKSLSLKNSCYNVFFSGSVHQQEMFPLLCLRSPLFFLELSLLGITLYKDVWNHFHFHKTSQSTETKSLTFARFKMSAFVGSFGSKLASAKKKVCLSAKTRRLLLFTVFNGAKLSCFENDSPSFTDYIKFSISLRRKI